MTKLSTKSISTLGYDLPDDIAAMVRRIDTDGLDATMVDEAQQAIDAYGEWLAGGYTDDGYYAAGDMLGRQAEEAATARIRAALAALVA